MAIRTGTVSGIALILCACITFSAAQNEACTGAIGALQSACGPYQSAVQSQTSLIGADDAALTSAVQASPTKPSPECCNAIAPFNAVTPPCACDPTIIQLGQSQGLTSAALLTLQRAGSIACATLAPPITFGRPTQTAC